MPGFSVKKAGNPLFFGIALDAVPWLKSELFLMWRVAGESFVPVSAGRGLWMNKNELVSAVAEKASLEKGKAQAAVDAVFAAITEELKKGGDVRLVGFGNFSVTKRAASTGRNPQTGATVNIPARNAPKFAAGKGLKDAVN